MRIPVIRGVIDRRILANFRMDPSTLRDLLPPPFRPQLVAGYAIGGICLIRLVKVRPRFLPLPIGIRSENAAHRIAVEWNDGDVTKQGVYIPRRDSNSRLNHWAGGTVFPGLHHFANFDVTETADSFSVAFRSQDDQEYAKVAGTLSDHWLGNSVFPTLEAASQFFELGSLGYSPTKTKHRYEGLELRCRDWQVHTLEVEEIESSFFANKRYFPPGSIEFDCALLMRDVHHEWHGQREMCCQASPAVAFS